MVPSAKPNGHHSKHADRAVLVTVAHRPLQKISRGLSATPLCTVWRRKWLGHVGVCSGRLVRFLHLGRHDSFFLRVLLCSNVRATGRNVHSDVRQSGSIQQVAQNGSVTSWLWSCRKCRSDHSAHIPCELVRQVNKKGCLAEKFCSTIGIVEAGVDGSVL